MMKRMDKPASALAKYEEYEPEGPTESTDIAVAERPAAPLIDMGAVEDEGAIKLTQTRVLELYSARLRLNRVYVEPNDQESENAINAYKELRTRIIQDLEERSIRSLMVTGPGKGVGKTLTAINLAIGIARLSRRTALLVDLDLRRPSIHQYFDFEPDCDLVDVAGGRCGLAHALVSPGIERLTLLPVKNSHANSSELLMAPAMQHIIQEVKDRYPERIVVFDVPPVLGRDDVAALIPCMDSYLMVVEDGETTRGDISEAIIKMEGLPIIGVVLNKSSKLNTRYYY